MVFCSVESATNLETIKESYVNAIDELNQELLTIKSQYEELNTEKQRLADELENRITDNSRDHSKLIIGRFPLFGFFTVK